MKPTKTISGKLITLQLCCAVLVVTVLYTMVDRELSRKMKDNFFEHGQVITQALAKSVEPSLVNRDPTSVQSALDAVLRIPNVQWAYVTAPDGTVLAHTFVPKFPDSLRGTSIPEKRDGSRGSMPADGKSIMVFNEPVLTGIVGMVHIGLNQEKLIASIHRMEMLVLASITGVMLVVTIAFAVLAGRIVAPIHALTSAAQVLGGDAQAEFHVLAVKSDDEVGLLTRAFNRMVTEIRRHETTLRSILESMGDGVVVADEKGKFLVFNPAAEQILGLGSTDITPQQWTERYGLYLSDTVTPYPPEQLPLARAIRGESVDSAEVFVPHPKRPDGLVLSVTGRPLRGGDGVLCGGVVVFHDVTERKRAEKALVRAKEEAERASRFKDQFLSTMSHELRTPLNAVLGFSDLLAEERYGPLNERQQRYVSHIHTGGKHLLKLVSDILDLSKIEAGRMDLFIQDVPVESAFAGVFSNLRLLADKKSQILSQYAEPALAVRADPTRLKQVLLNLVGNAIKFTPEGGRIELSARKVDGRVRVEVRDTGPGIPAQEQKRIFEAFYRLRQSGAIEGTGLGLAITQRLVELHGGQLGLESEPGQGSCFYFSFPAVAKIREAPVRENGSSPRVSENSRILVIEDDPAAAQLIQSQLTSAGYEVVVCQHPGGAASLAAELQPAAITLDLLMKPTNGWELLSQLKSAPHTASIPVIVITILDQPAIGAILGANEYLVKPVDKPALLAAVERCFDHRGGAAPQEQSILVVEDDAATGEIIRELLTGQGYAVSTAADGAQARGQVNSSLPKLVILDLLLPKVSGFELLSEWRASARTADLPVFVLTSKELSPEEEKYLRAHSESLFRKQQPWQEALLMQLRRVLREREAVKA